MSPFLNGQVTVCTEGPKLRNAAQKPNELEDLRTHPVCANARPHEDSPAAREQLSPEAACSMHSGKINAYVRNQSLCNLKK